MATATKKAATKRKSGPRKTASKKGAAKKSSTKVASKKGASRKGAAKKNKLGVKNSLVNNINKHKEKGDSKTKKKSSIDKRSYRKMKDNWGKDKE
jgi:hypothetical protein